MIMRFELQAALSELSGEPQIMTNDAFQNTNRADVSIAWMEVPPTSIVVEI